MTRSEQILASIDQKLLRIAKALEKMNNITANGGVYSLEVIDLERENEETKSEQD